MVLLAYGVSILYFNQISYRTHLHGLKNERNLLLYWQSNEQRHEMKISAEDRKPLPSPSLPHPLLPLALVNSSVMFRVPTRSRALV